jgi:hypothetical protein
MTAIGSSRQVMAVVLTRFADRQFHCEDMPSAWLVAITFVLQISGIPHGTSRNGRS